MSLAHPRLPALRSRRPVPAGRDRPRTRLRGRLVALSAVLTCLIAVPAYAASPSRDGVRNEGGVSGAAALRKSIAELVAMPGGPPGVAVVVQIGSSRTFYPGGVAALGGRAPRINDHMRIASVAKAFSGATALVLVNKGVLRLRDTIGRWLPYLPAPWHRVTLRELLDHTSGIPDYTRSKKLEAAFQKSPRRAPRPRKLLSYARAKLNFPPGTQYRYSNSDNIAVGLMVQAATGRPYARVLTSDVLRPLGLAQTSLPAGVHIDRPFIHGYALDGRTGRPQDDVTHDLAAGWAWASGGIVSTPADLNRFIRGYVSGRLISAKLRARWQRLFMPASGSEPRGPGFNSAAMALFRYQTRCGTVYGHSGNTLGYTQYAFSTPDGSRSATVSINVQVTQESKGQQARVFSGLLRVAQSAICRALH
jgi:D-alanyl-D-alanine carboxypeptidase